MNPSSTALIYQSFGSDFDDPRSSKLRAGNGAQESIWIQDEDAVDLICHWTNMGMSIQSRVRILDTVCIFNKIRKSTFADYVSRKS